MAKSWYQLNDARLYQVQLGQAKWVSMLEFKAGFHGILFEPASLYDLTFITHWGKFQWFRILMGVI